MVEASSGKVYANMWRAKSETPFRMLFVGSVLAFFAASILSYVIGVVIRKSSDRNGNRRRCKDSSIRFYRIAANVPCVFNS